MKELIDEIEKYLPQSEKMNKDVSGVKIGWQLDHSLKVIISVCQTIEKSNPSEYSSKFKLAKMILFLLGKIPRGRGKAPKVVTSKNDVTELQIRNQLPIARQEFSKLISLSNDKYFKHPLFGNLTKKESIKFLKIHTEHHLKIVRDIIG